MWEDCLHAFPRLILVYADFQRIAGGFGGVHITLYQQATHFVVQWIKVRRPNAAGYMVENFS